MKKYLLILCALLLTAVGASASEDLSSLLGNGSSNWTNSTGSFADGRENYNGSGLSAGKLLYQTISGLTNGTYVVEFYAAVNNANGDTKPYGEDYAQVYANTTTKDITVGALSGGNFGSTATTWGEEYHHILVATVTDGTLEFGVQNTSAAGNWAIAVAESLILIDSEWSGNATAHMCTTGGGSDNAAPTNWTSTGTDVFPGLHINKHSVEADASGMVTPFVEYWYGSTSAMVTPETISHTQLTGLPKGEYTISVDARIMNESGGTIGTGTTFNANGKSVDIHTGTDGTYGTETEVYGTYHLIAEVDETGILDISFSVPETVTYNWLAWKNLNVVYTGESLPTLTYVTGTMNAEIEAAMKAAIDTYNDSKSADDYAAALDAIDAAEASVAYYAEVKDAIENVLPTITLDELGTAAWNNGSFLAGYNARTLTNESVTAAFISAEASQAAGTELVYALTANEWICSTNGDGQGNGPTYMNPGYETYTADSYVAGKVMYQRLSDLPEGYSYKVEFYGSAKSVNGGGNSVTGTGTAVAFANDKQQDVNIVSTPNSNDLLTGGYLRSFSMVTVDEDNALEYGLMNLATGGNWYMCDNYKITILGVVEDATIGDAEASATYVQPGQEVSITFDAYAPSDDYELVGEGFTSTEGISVSYTGDATFTFTVPSDASGTFTVTIPAGQLYYTYSNEKVSNEDGSNAETTLTFTVPLLSEAQMSGMFLKNLYGGDLMSRGKDYGTRADVDFIGIPLALVLNDDGKYIIRYADADLSAASSNYFYGENWAWADGNTSNATTFTIEEVYDTDETTLLGYHFISDYGYLYRYDATLASATDTDDNCALAVNGVKNDNYSDDNQIIWTFVDIEERDAIKAAWVASQKVAIATEAGLTGITTGDEFDAYVATMTETAIVENEISTASEANWTGGTYTAQGVESYQTATRLSRSFSGLEPGIYKITLNGLDRNSDNDYSWQMYNDGYTDLSESYIYANDYEINLQAWGSEATLSGSTYTPNNMTDASTMFDEGSYLNTLYTYVGEDGALSIQIALLVTEYYGWAQVKNFSLYKLDSTEETIEWEMTSAGWGTLILPFAVEDEEVLSGLTLYAGSALSLDSDGTTITVSDASETIAANTPYLVSGTTAKTYEFTGVATNTQNSYQAGMLVGTLVDLSQDAGTLSDDGSQYVLQNHDGEVAFYPITDESEGVTLDAYHCYLTTDGTEVTAFHLPGMSTGIVAVESDVIANDAIYDLSGRRVAKAVKGVYIMNGKKVLVK